MHPTVAQLDTLSRASVDGSPVAVDNHPWRCSLELLTDPPVETAWLIETLIPAESVVLFSGREGCMKSWLALDWACAVAEGKPWLGRLCEAGAVLYVDAEMPGGLFRARLHAVGGSLNLNIWRWQDATFLTSLGHPALLEAAKDHRLIVIDTLKRFMAGMDENSSDDMAKITAQLRELTRHGASVLTLHHAPKDPDRQGYRGSTELGAGVDITLTVEKRVTDGTESLALSAQKTRHAESPRLTLRVNKGESRPVFTDITDNVKEAKAQAQLQDLEQLHALLVKLTTQQGCAPNQAAIVDAAKTKGLAGSRKTVLTRLGQGEGTFWRSRLDGRSRLYEPIVYPSPLSHPPMPEQVDNGTSPGLTDATEVIEDVT